MVRFDCFLVLMLRHLGVNIQMRMIKLFYFPSYKTFLTWHFSRSFGCRHSSLQIARESGPFQPSLKLIAVRHLMDCSTHVCFAPCTERKCQQGSFLPGFEVLLGVSQSSRIRHATVYQVRNAVWFQLRSC